MSRNKMPSIKQIVEDLREKGELDEVKLKRLRSKIIDFYIIWFLMFSPLLLLFRSGKLNDVVFALVGILFGVLVAHATKRKLHKTAQLYTVGERTMGELISSHPYYSNMTVHYVFEVGDVSYKQEGLAQHYTKTDAHGGFSKRIQNTLCRIYNFFLKKNQKIKSIYPLVGDKVDILYCQENPEINCIWLQYVDGKCNLRKTT
jgi:hypothetical protein